MRRHSRMEFAAGTMVFPRWRRRPRPQHRYRLGGAAAAVVGAAVRRRTRPGRGTGVRRRPRDVRRIGGAVRRSGGRPERHCRGRIGVRGLAARPGRRHAVVRRLPAPRKPGASIRPAATVGQLGHPGGRAHPPLRHLFLCGGFAGGSARRRGERRIRPCRLDDAAGRHRRLRGRSQHPATADLDTAGLAGRPHRRRRVVDRAPDRHCPAALEIVDDNWVFEFFDSDRYHQARKAGGSMGWPS